MPSVSSNNPRLRAKLNHAIQLNTQGKKHQALMILKSLFKLYPRSAAVAGYLGGIYFETGNVAAAAQAFARAVKINPASELASVGLFHSLWKQHAKEEAMAEMRRFLSIKASKEYATLLQELAVAGELAPKAIVMGAA